MGRDEPAARTRDSEAPAEAPHSRHARAWREQLSAYAVPDTRRAALCLFTSIVPYLGLSAAIYVLLGRSPLALLLAIPAAVFLLRLFIVFHDCTHGSLRATRLKLYDEQRKRLVSFREARRHASIPEPC